MNFNNRPLNKGAIFIEVAIALAMAGVILSSTLGLQVNVFRVVIRNSFTFSRIFPLDSMFKMAQKDRMLHQEKPFYQKVLTDPDSKITFEKLPVNNASSLGRFKRLFKETSKAVWTDWSGAREKELIGFVFIPEPKPKEEEKT